MAMVINNNMSAKNTLNQTDKNDKALTKSLKKVSSGMRINSAEDDASGYSISEKMRTQMRSLDQDIDIKAGIFQGLGDFFLFHSMFLQIFICQEPS